MLTPKLIPIESEFTESDLKPGLRVRRKSDGAECVVHKHTQYWTFHCNYEALTGEHSCSLFTEKQAIDFLRSDFTPVEPRYKTVGELPPRTIFDTADYKRIERTSEVASGGGWACIREDGSGTPGLDNKTPVTRILGKLVFVEE